jgi:hypothetical protein
MKLGSIYIDPEAKEQYKEWRNSGSPRPKIKTQTSSSKVLASDI